jgi:hypothetical protein
VEEVVEVVAEEVLEEVVVGDGLGEEAERVDGERAEEVLEEAMRENANEEAEEVYQPVENTEEVVLMELIWDEEIIRMQEERQEIEEWLEAEMEAVVVQLIKERRATWQARARIKVPVEEAQKEEEAWELMEVRLEDSIWQIAIADREEAVLQVAEAREAAVASEVVIALTREVEWQEELVRLAEVKLQLATILKIGAWMNEIIWRAKEIMSLAEKRQAEARMIEREGWIAIGALSGCGLTKTLVKRQRQAERQQEIAKQAATIQEEALKRLTFMMQEKVTNHGKVVSLLEDILQIRIKLMRIARQVAEAWKEAEIEQEEMAWLAEVVQQEKEVNLAERSKLLAVAEQEEIVGKAQAALLQAKMKRK